jgi:outer membrane protein assembly factor BamB
MPNTWCLKENCERRRLKGEKEMEILRNKSKTATITFVLVLTIAVSFVTYLPAVRADDNVETAAYMSVEPNPIGVGQQVSVNLWLLPAPPTSADRYHGLTVQITKPNGSTQTIGPLVTSSQGTCNFIYEPDQVGIWYFQFSYLGETIRNFSIGASQSPKTTLIVQQQQIQPYPDFPLPAPAENWTFPISGTNRLWSSLSGNWLMRGYNASYGFPTDVVAAFNPFSTAPRSAHVVWTEPIAIGGLVGGEYGNLSYYSGLPYEDKFAPPIIISGRVYCNLFVSQDSYVLPGFVCLDLRTGKELWRKNYTQITCGQLYDFESANQAGVVGPYLWSTGTSTYYMYDADTGNLMLSFANAVPSGPTASNPIVFGSDGTMFVYVLDGGNGWLAMWNSTKAFQANGMIPVDPGSGVASWRPVAGTYDWTKGIEWNVTIPAYTDQNTSLAGVSSERIQAVANGVIVAMRSVGSSYVFHSGYDATTGEQLWAFNRTQPGAHEFTNITAFGEGIYAQFDSATRRYFAYDIHSGQQLWQSDPADYPWGAYSGGAVIAYDRLYSTSTDGYVYAFDVSNGKEVWKFNSENTTETIYGTYPFRYGPIVADGVVFAGTGEQVPTQPLYRGEQLYAIDANTGKGLWNISGSMNLNAIADGYLLAYDVDDNRIYCFGKGETTTTISLSSPVITNGTSVLIQGTITDNSPAQPGTPCISRDYMGGWLQYLLMQKPCPYPVLLGVTVELRVLLSNGTLKELGLPLSDEYGRFNFTWTPPEPGVYAILARFPGDDSYYVTFNWAESDLSVIAAPPTSEKPLPALTTVDLVIIVAVAVTIILNVYNIFAVRKMRRQN